MLVVLLVACVLANRFSMSQLQKDRVRAYDAHYVDSRIDNFNPNDKRTYKQRFFVNMDHWDNKVNGPIFLDIGGEGEVVAPPSGGDEIDLLAKKYNALAFSLEHRFYGVSFPFFDTTLEHLRYLDDKQALEDVIHFIDFIDEQLHPNDHVSGAPKNKWVLFGGSYPGALASWVRTKYPHMSQCAVSSSGVVNSIYKFPEFDTQVYASAGEECGDILVAITEEMERMAETDKKALYDLFQVDEGYDIGDFFYYMADSGVMAMQYGHKEELCDLVVEAKNSGASIVEAYAAYVNGWFADNMNPYMGATYDRREMKKTAFPNTDYINRQWLYQTCRNLSWFQNAPDDLSVRSKKYLQFDYFLELCEDVFEPMDPHVDLTNLYYGGKTPYAPNVYYVDFWQDPWRLASTDEHSLPEGIGSVFELVKCHNCGHCQDMHPPKDTDPEELTRARSNIAAFVDDCLSKE